MARNKQLFKHFSTPSLESQVLEITKENSQKLNENKGAPAPSDELIIEPKSEEMASRWSELRSHIKQDEKVLPAPTTPIIMPAHKENDMVDIPDLPLEDLQPETVEDKSVKDESGGSVVFGIIGAGQAGGRLAEAFYKLGYKKCLAVNTALHDLNGLSLPDSQKLVMDTGALGGAGKDMEVGRQAAEKAQQEVYEKLQSLFGNVDRVLVCAGAGGGTGGGSVSSLVQVAKKYLLYVNQDPNRVGVFLTLPTAGECASPVVADNATKVVTSLCESAQKGEISPLVLVDNEKVKKLYPKLTVTQFWPTVNATVAGLFHVFNVLSTKDGNPTSFDPADYTRVLNQGGCMIMGLTGVQKYDDGTDISKAIRSNLEGNLLCGGFNISTAKSAACIAMASERILNEVPGLMTSLETGFDTLANITGGASVFRGIYQGDKDKLSVYTMLSGLATPQQRINDLTKFKK